MEFQNRSKGAKAGTRNRNVTENNTGALQMKMEQWGMRLGLGTRCGPIS